MAARSIASAITGAGASIIGYKACFEGADFGDMIRGLAAAAASGGVLLAPARQAVSTDATAAALSASLKTIETLLRAQEPRGAGAGLLLSLLLPAAGGALWHRYGWNAFGWVTPEALSAGLQAVTERVGAKVRALGETLALKLATVDAKLVEAAACVQQVAAAQEELQVEVHAVAQGVTRLEARVAPIEGDTHRTAQGVDVLCALIKTSGLLANASPDALHRLDAYTGGAPRELAGPELPALPSRPSAAPPSASALAAPSFMRGLLAEPPPGVHAR